MLSAPFLQPAFELSERRRIIGQLLALIAAKRLEFDSVAFCGAGGTLIAPSLCDSLKKNLVLIRKAADDSHSGLAIEGVSNVGRFIIVDDVIGRGFTLRWILDVISLAEPTASPAAAVLYRTANRCVKNFDWHGLKIPIHTLAA